MQVLVVDDDETFRMVMNHRLAAAGHDVECAASGEAALERLGQRVFDVVLLDLRMAGLGGLETLDQIRDADLPCEVVVLTGEPDYDDCVEAMKRGAFHYLCKPTEPALIVDTLQRAADHLRLRRENAALRRMLQPDQPEMLVGESTAIRSVLTTVKQIAPTDARVIILGESGSGKGLLARTIHGLSRRVRRPFLDVHCGAIAPQLLESELFGHERGAFTGAVRDKPGLLELADGGTLFLDEFADMTTEMQSKLLKVLDGGEMRRVGGVRSFKVDVRVLVATNRDIDELVKSGKIREDLLHRLDVIRVTLPPLRARREDIAPLVDHFLMLHQRHGLGPKTLAKEALARLQEYHWPGNVRELGNTVERLVILSRKSIISAEDLPPHLHLPPRATAGCADAVLPLLEMERRHIERVLTMVAGNRSSAARLLGIDRATLGRKLRRTHETA